MKMIPLAKQSKKKKKQYNKSKRPIFPNANRRFALFIGRWDDDQIMFFDVAKETGVAIPPELICTVKKAGACSDMRQILAPSV